MSYYLTAKRMVVSLQESEASMEEKKERSEDPVVDLFPDDDAEEHRGESVGLFTGYLNIQYTYAHLTCHTGYALVEVLHKHTCITSRTCQTSWQ